MKFDEGYQGQTVADPAPVPQDPQVPVSFCRNSVGYCVCWVVFVHIRPLLVVMNLGWHFCRESCQSSISCPGQSEGYNPRATTAKLNTGSRTNPTRKKNRSHSRTESRTRTPARTPATDTATATARPCPNRRYCRSSRCICAEHYGVGLPRLRGRRLRRLPTVRVCSVLLQPAVRSIRTARCGWCRAVRRHRPVTTAAGYRLLHLLPPARRCCRQTCQWRLLCRQTR